MTQKHRFSLATYIMLSFIEDWTKRTRKPNTERQN